MTRGASSTLITLPLIHSGNAARQRLHCQFDEAIRKDQRTRKGALTSFLYVHRSGKPLREVDLRSEAEKGQGSLWDNECEGMCGL